MGRVWYNRRMRDLADKYEQSGLHVEEYDNIFDAENMCIFSTRDIEVDGIPSSARNHEGVSAVHKNLMFGAKETVYAGEVAHERRDGYMYSYMAAWDSPYSPAPYKHGEIDEEIYLITGVVVGVNDHEERAYLLEIVDQIKKKRELNPLSDVYTHFR